jgi:DNA repair protein RadC
MNKDSPPKGEGHRGRLRDKFLSSGLSGFHDYEVIELLLTLGTPRKDCKEPAKAALKKFKTLQAVFEASPSELCEIPGIGSMNVFGIKLIKSVSDRYLERKLLQKDPIYNSKQLFDFLSHRIGAGDRESFMVVYLNAKNLVMGTEVLFEGTLTASSVYPREVVRSGLEQRAAALIFAHNHPSGDPAPSPEDVTITRRLVFACSVVGIAVHEHLIIGERRYFSFADQGLLKKMQTDFQAVCL